MKKDPQTLAKPWRYGLGMLGLTIPGQMYVAYSSFYYSDKLGLGLQYISLGMIFYALWDAFNDPIMGFLSDRTRTKIGRRRPWVLAAAPLFALFFYLFFTPPQAVTQSTTAFILYFTSLLMLTETMGTITHTNYHALFPELFKDEVGRTKSNAIRQSLQLVGMIIGVSLTPMLAEAIGFPASSALLGVLGMGLLVFSILGCKEDPAYAESPTPGLKESLQAVLSNKNFWVIAGTNLFYQATSGLALAAIPFFVKYALQLPDSSVTYMSAAVFVVAIPAVSVWASQIKRFGALNTWRASLAFLGLSFLPMYLVHSLGASIVVGAFIGIGIAGVTACLDLISALVIDEDAARSGLRREGIYNSTGSFIIRFSGLVRSLVFYLVFLIFGFSSGEVLGSNPGLAVRTMLSIFPFVLMLISFAFSLFVKFDQNEAPNPQVGGSKWNAI